MKSIFFSKKNIITFLICLCLNIHFIISQTNEQNLEKYWHYRYRLTHQFMVVGDGNGESLPADIRNLYNGDILHFGETPVQLGYYLGVLATEYHLLKKNNQNTSQTLTELYYALSAAARLDLASDGVKNGYLFRDDVNPNTFLDVNHKTTLNNNITQPNYIPNSGEACIINNIESDYFAAEPSASQDMLYNLLMGLALVNKYVDDGNSGTSFYNYITGSPFGFLNFQETAKHQADLIVSYIKDSPFNSKNWKLTKPDGSDISNDNGGNAAFFAYGLAKSGEFITGNNYTDTKAIFFKPEWQQFQNDDVVKLTFSNVTLSSILAAISDSWADRSLFSNDNTTKAGIQFNGDYDAGSKNGISWDANHHGNELFYGAIHRLLHGYDYYDAPAFDLCKMQSILNSAPYDGPYCHSATDLASGGWAASRRFYNAPPDQDIGQTPPGPDFEGNYNGLDYMLFHNLYYCLQEGQYNVHETMPFWWDQADQQYTQPGVSDLYYVVGNPYQLSQQYKKILIYSTNINELGGYFGAAAITGGPQGVELNNVEVDEGAELTISTIDGCGSDPEGYVFNSSYYKHFIPNNNIQNDNLPPYKMIPESELSKPSNLKVSPNPNSGIFLISVTKNNQPIGVKAVKVYDMVGRIIWENNTPSGNLFNVDISGYSPGIYYVRAVNETGDIDLKKLIKE